MVEDDDGLNTKSEHSEICQSDWDVTVYGWQSRPVRALWKVNTFFYTLHRPKGRRTTLNYAQRSGRKRIKLTHVSPLPSWCSLAVQPYTSTIICSKLIGLTSRWGEIRGTHIFDFAHEWKPCHSWPELIFLWYCLHFLNEQSWLRTSNDTQHFLNQCFRPLGRGWSRWGTGWTFLELQPRPRLL